jgi:hypothetical protein
MLRRSYAAAIQNRNEEARADATEVMRINLQFSLAVQEQMSISRAAED